MPFGKKGLTPEQRAKIAENRDDRLVHVIEKRMVQDRANTALGRTICFACGHSFGSTFYCGKCRDKKV